MNTSSDSMIDKITEMMDNLIWLEWQKEDEMEMHPSKQVSKPIKRSKSKSPSKKSKRSLSKSS